MEEERFVSSRENPRNLGFLPERGPSTSINNYNSKGMPIDLIQKPSPSILDRFRALLEEREEELRLSDDDDVPVLSAEEIVRFYEIVLSELTFNSKPIISELTMIPGEQKEYSRGITAAIYARILELHNKGCGWFRWVDEETQAGTSQNGLEASTSTPTTSSLSLEFLKGYMMGSIKGLKNQVTELEDLFNKFNKLELKKAGQ